MKGYWNNLRPFEKRVFVGVTAMVFLVFNMWFVIPHFSDWGRERTRMGVAQDKLRKYETEIKQKPWYEKELGILEVEGMSVPEEEQSVQFIRAIQLQEQQSGVQITSISNQKPRTNQFFLEIAQNISLIAGEPQLVDFLFNLGSTNSLIRVRDLSLRTDAPRQKLTGTVKLVANYQKNLTKPAPVATPPPAKSTPAATKTVPPATKSTTPATKPGASPATKPAAPNKNQPSSTNKKP